MTVISPSLLKKGFELNTNIIKRQTNGINHEESLLQFPFRGNCMNWVIGHILIRRCTVMELLDLEPVLTADERVRYATGSEPIVEDGEGVIALERLLELLEDATAKISEGFDTVSDEKWNAMHDDDYTVAETIFGLYFHDTYHTGQPEFHRQLAGKNDRVIG